MWQAEADIELTLSASPAMAVGQSKLTLANLGWNMVCRSDIMIQEIAQHYVGYIGINTNYTLLSRQ